MNDAKLFIAYCLFAISIVFVCIWSIVRGGYQDSPSTIEDVYVLKEALIDNRDNFRDSLNWDTFTKALIWVESKGDSKAIGSKNDVGVLQITPILVEDCNRIIKYEAFTLEDRLDSLKSVEMFNIIQDHYNPQHDYHWALKLWNSGAPLSYHRKVMDKFNEIKDEREM